MTDPLGLLPHSGRFVAERLVPRLRERGDRSAKILAAQARWLRTAEPAALAEVVRLVAPVVDPTTKKRRFPRVGLAGAFSDGVSFVGREAWVADNDIISLTDGGLFDPARHESPWDANAEVIDELDAAIARGRYPTALRLRLCEGSERIHTALRAHGLARAVTHLDLQLERESDESELGHRFPGLRGLSVRASKLRQALRVPLPELRSLVLRGAVDPATLRWARARAPKLAHLALFRTEWSEAFLTELLDHTEDLRTLQSFDVNGARRFPFAALAAERPRWTHLALLALPGHLVPDEDRERFAADPQVLFVAHDRREVVALDLETHGWPEGR